MRKKGALLVLLLVGLAGCGGRAGFTAPIEASTAPGDTVTAVTERASTTGSQAGCPAQGEWRPTAFTRYWPYSYRVDEVSTTRDRVVLDWLDYDAAGEAQWYSFRYRPNHHLPDSQDWSPWIDVEDSRAVMSSLEAGRAYSVQVRAAVDHAVPGDRPDCFFTRSAERMVRTVPAHLSE